MGKNDREKDNDTQPLTPEDDATTLAGLVIHKAQTIPQPGQIFSFDGYRFEVMRRYRNKLTSLKITREKKKTGR